ncbi:hypothetical protein HYPSUDRAFT_1002759 [Hypholoma sublateritium FD-334 SS-4]|uniref:DUF6534 domain-containing protein n=1 Tax=Hypholoma sublateritium (strain FD-334 SS-4) TaxID=945553 RepID=A0A0D2NFQ0_HYPSF|nr:hypothetical protein HYPSUDRAFT_1002759 [Hypholoma sublateritium FD-334 SS-4]
MANFYNTVGALEIGTSFSLVLFGIMTMQTYMYWCRFEEDRPAFKVLVTVVWLLELGHTIAVSRELYRAMLLISGATASRAYPSFGVVTILSGFITTTVQLFFSYRVYTALPSPYRLVGALTALVALARCGTSTYIGAAAVAGGLDVAQSQRYSHIITVLLASAVAIDVVIAAAMLGFLGRKREHSRRLMKMIDHMMLITLRTGLMTSIAAVAVLILYVTMPRNYIHLSVFVCLAKIYSNSLLSACAPFSRTAPDLTD